MKTQFLRPLYAEAGDWVSVYLDTSRTAENAADVIAVRWQDARAQLAAAGADGATLNAVAPELTVGHSPGSGRAVFARAGRAGLSAPVRVVPPVDAVRLAPLPNVMPLLAQREVMAPHLRVAVSRAGGEILAMAGDDPVELPAVVEDDEVHGQDWPVHKPRAGGWSEPRYERSAEHTWDENARQLAARVTEASSHVGARCIVIAGDARARSLVLQHLSQPLRESAVVVDREIPAGSPELAAAADEALRARAEREARDRYDEWRSLLAHGGGVEGLAQTIAALRDGLVADVLVRHDVWPASPVWIGPGAEMALSEQEARDRGAARPLQDRADAAIARAVTDTDAELRFLPADLDAQLPQDGICGVLRATPRAAGQ